MKSLNIRGVDDEVMTEFKLESAKAGKALRDWVLDVLCEAIDGRGSSNGGTPSDKREVVGSNPTPTPSKKDDPITSLVTQGSVIGGARFEPPEFEEFGQDEPPDPREATNLTFDDFGQSALSVKCPTCYKKMRPSPPNAMVCPTRHCFTLDDLRKRRLV